MHTPKTDWCKMVKDYSNNLMFKQMVKIANDSAPGIIHECPYTVIIIFNALTVNTLTEELPKCLLIFRK